MRTPESKATDFADFLEGQGISEAWADLGIDPLASPLVVFFVTVSYHSPYRPFDYGGLPPTLVHREWQEALESVLGWLRSSVEPPAVQKKLKKLQKWEWGAIVTDLPSLIEELSSRYALSEAEPETDWDSEAIPGGIVISCQALLRGNEL